jgi:hypothetical protein
MSGQGDANAAPDWPKRSLFATLAHGEKSFCTPLGVTCFSVGPRPKAVATPSVCTSFPAFPSLKIQHVLPSRSFENFDMARPKESKSR